MADPTMLLASVAGAMASQDDITSNKPAPPEATSSMMLLQSTLTELENAWLKCDLFVNLSLILTALELQSAEGENRSRFSAVEKLKQSLVIQYAHVFQPDPQTTGDGRVASFLETAHCLLQMWNNGNPTLLANQFRQLHNPSYSKAQRQEQLAVLNELFRHPRFRPADLLTPPLRKQPSGLSADSRNGDASTWQGGKSHQQQQQEGNASSPSQRNHRRSDGLPALLPTTDEMVTVAVAAAKVPAIGNIPELPKSIVCGRGARTKHWNRGYRDFVRQYAGQYSLLNSKQDKTEFSMDLVKAIQQRGSQFVKLNENDQEEEPLTDMKARDKVSQLLREEAAKLKKGSPNTGADTTFSNLNDIGNGVDGGGARDVQSSSMHNLGVGVGIPLPMAPRAHPKPVRSINSKPTIEQLAKSLDAKSMLPEHILVGRGPHVNQHNRGFREYVRHFAPDYDQLPSKQHKVNFSQNLLEEIKKFSIFVVPDQTQVIGDEPARRKVASLLRDSARHMRQATDSAGGQAPASQGQMFSLQRRQGDAMDNENDEDEEDDEDEDASDQSASEAGGASHSDPKLMNAETGKLAARNQVTPNRRSLTMVPASGSSTNMLKAAESRSTDTQSKSAVPSGTMTRPSLPTSNSAQDHRRPEGPVALVGHITGTNPMVDMTRQPYAQQYHPSRQSQPLQPTQPPAALHQAPVFRISGAQVDSMVGEILVERLTNVFGTPRLLELVAAQMKQDSRPSQTSQLLENRNIRDIVDKRLAEILFNPARAGKDRNNSNKRTHDAASNNSKLSRPRLESKGSFA